MCALLERVENNSNISYSDKTCIIPVIYCISDSVDTADIHTMILKVLQIKKHGLERRFVIFFELVQQGLFLITTEHLDCGFKLLKSTLMKILQS